jgi:hypothetical protein
VEAPDLATVKDFFSLIWTTIVTRRLYPQNSSSTPMASSGIREKMRIELVIREGLRPKIIDFKGKERLILN